MSLPNVTINFANGALGGVSATDDNFFLFAFYAESLTAGTVKVLTSPSDINSDEDATVAAILTDFYEKAGSGTRVAYIKIKTDEDSGISYADHYAAIAAVFEQYPAISGIMFVNTDNTDTYNAGTTLVAAMQSIAESLLSEYNAPVFCLGNIASASADASLGASISGIGANRAGVVAGNFVGSVSNNIYTAGRSIIGLVAGRLAANDVQVKCSRVKDGALTTSDLMLPSASVAGITAAQQAAGFDNGYIVPRTFNGKTGWFLSDDALATAASDDFHAIARRRVIDKAYRIAYRTMLEHVNEEVPVSNTGTLLPSWCKSWESEVVNAIYNTMTVNNNLSTDPTDDGDKGCSCYINPNQNVLANNTVAMVVKVKPYGYASYITIELGFLVEQ